MTYIALSETAAAKQHELACKQIRTAFDSTEPEQWLIRSFLIQEAKVAQLDAEFIAQLEKDK